MAAPKKQYQKTNDSTSLVRQSNVDTVKGFLKNHIKQIEAALPKHMTPDRMARIALTEIRQNPKLQEADPYSFFAAIIKCSQLGLEPGFDAHLVPYKREVKVLPGFKGACKLVRNTGDVKAITAHVVYANDEYDVALGCEESITHRPKLDGPRGELLFCYAVATFKDGIKQIEVMTREEIEHVREKSQPYANYIKHPTWDDGNPKDPPAWVTDEAEMWKKTVILRACKRLPQSAELKDMIALEYQAERGESQNLTSDIFGDDVIDVGEDQFWDLCQQEGISRDDPDMMAYLKEICTHYRLDMLEAQTTYGISGETFKKFFTSYQGWIAKASDKKPSEKKDKPQSPPPLVVACPNLDGRERPSSDCEECQDSHGCPENK